MNFKKTRYLFWIVLLAAIGGCQRTLTTSKSAVTGHVSPEIKIAANPVKVPEAFGSAAYQGLRYAYDVHNFYGQRAYEPFWLENNVRSARADTMITVIGSARRYGLLPQRYHFYEIPELVLEPMDQNKMARLDIVLTDAFLSMASDLKRGRMKNYLSVADSLQVALLTMSLKAADINEVLASQEPPYDGYQLLKQALNRMLDTLNMSEQNLLLAGITNDSIESHRKVQRIEINLERWRNEQAQLDHVYAWINVPAFMFYLVENNHVVMESEVIVGKPSTPTPMLSSKIDCITIFPYWYVPRKISVEEYLPVIKKDTSFITRNNFDVMDRQGNIVPLSSINWKEYNANNFPFILRQREGTENSLGIIKFSFDNPYAVFLHDTNAKRLFRNDVRAYSHGCIRLDKSVQFAHYLVASGRTKISPRDLDRYFSGKKRMTISLQQPVPIYVRYFTCDVTNGQLHFYRDLYKRDHTFIKALYDQHVF